MYRKTSAGENFCSFCGFLLDPESFPTNYGLVDQQYKATKLLQQKFYCKQLFFNQNANILLLGCFTIYGSYQSGVLTIKFYYTSYK